MLRSASAIVATVQFGNAERLGQVQFDRDAETVEASCSCAAARTQA